MSSNLFTNDEKQLIIDLIIERKKLVEKYDSTHIAAFEKKLILDHMDSLISKIKVDIDPQTINHPDEEEDSKEFVQRINTEVEKRYEKPFSNSINPC